MLWASGHTSDSPFLSPLVCPVAENPANYHAPSITSISVLSEAIMIETDNAWSELTVTAVDINGITIRHDCRKIQ